MLVFDDGRCMTHRAIRDGGDEWNSYTLLKPEIHNMADTRSYYRYYDMMRKCWVITYTITENEYLSAI